tara:strand:+ start:372 stop:635 length:264 start_codon:yes stop_codon:yes gene_type:complete
MSKRAKQKRWPIRVSASLDALVSAYYEAVDKAPNLSGLVRQLVQEHIRGALQHLDNDERRIFIAAAIRVDPDFEAPKWLAPTDEEIY